MWYMGGSCKIAISVFEFLIAWVMFAGALVTRGFRVERGEGRLEEEVKGLRHERIS